MFSGFLLLFFGHKVLYKRCCFDRIHGVHAQHTPRLLAASFADLRFVQYAGAAAVLSGAGTGKAD